MTSMRVCTMAMMGMVLAASTVHAQQVVTLTPKSDVNAVLKTLKPGDTLRLVGTFETAVRFTKRDFGGGTLDASGALLREGLLMQGVHNLNVVGGTYGRTDADTRDWATMRIDNSSNISVSGTTVIGNGNLRGTGIRVSFSDFITIRDNKLSGHLGSILLYSSTNSLITRNKMVEASSDGIQVVGSNKVIVSSNTCSNFTPGPGAHPDCIQLWSISGKPLQSEIFVINNSAVGNIQAYLSSDPKTGSGANITFAGNYAAVSTTHTITCGNCINSTAFENVLANLPGAIRGPGSLKFGPSPTNSLFNNLFYDLQGRTDGWMPAPTWTSFVPFIAGLVGSKWDDRSFGFQPSAINGIVNSAVPEPANWMMLVLGFGLVGRHLRRRCSPRLVLA